MSSEKIRAPYNFVPFCSKPVARYEDISQLPPHDVWNPELLSGEIALTLTAETPVFVSDGAGRDNRGTPDFTKDAHGRYQIPGSTLRGLLRENMQILGFGCLRPEEDFQNIRLLYRSMADARASLKREAKDHYQTVLGTKTLQTGRGRRYTVAQNVRGGYLHCEGQKYLIRPVKGKVLSVPRNGKTAAPWKNRYAFSEPVWYLAKGDEVTDLSPQPRQGWQDGWILGTGFMHKQNRLYLFPAEDPNADGISLSTEEILSYRTDYEERQNALAGTRKDDRQNKEFWNLPKKGEKKPVFFLQRGAWTDFGMSQFLRISYEEPLRNGIPNLREELFLDYAHALFGFAEKDTSYRSRVSVGALRAEGNPRTMAPFSVILGGPKLSFFPAYTVNGLDYNRDDMRLRGFKQYWLKKEQIPPTPEKQQVATVMRPLPAGTRFSGTIRYRNLHRDELGLLLWCLRLEPGCFQSIGMGKPLGFGRVKVQIDSLAEYDPSRLYSPEGLAGSGIRNTEPADRVEELIRSYRRYLGEARLLTGKKADPMQRSDIQDFFYMRSEIRTDIGEVSYMDLPEFKNPGAPLPTVKEIREEKEKKPEPEKEASMDELLAALLKKSGGISGASSSQLPVRGKKKKKK